MNSLRPPVRIPGGLMCVIAIAAVMSPARAQPGAYPSAVTAPTGGVAAISPQWREELLTFVRKRDFTDGAVVPSERGIELRTLKLVREFWKLEARVPIKIELRKGEVGFLRFTARSLQAAAMTGETRLVLYVQETAEPWTKTFTKEIDLSSEWQRFDIPLRIGHTFEPGKSAVYFGFGTTPQVAEIADLEFLVYPVGTDIKSLPRTVRPVGEVSPEAMRQVVSRIQSFRRSVRSNAPDAIPTPGRVLHVTVAGSNDPDGSPERPFASVQAAINVAKPGDQIFVADGTYDRAENCKAVITRSGTPDAWIAIRAAPGARPRMVSREWNAFEVNNARYIEIRGFECIGIPDPKSQMSGNGIGIVKKSAHVRIIDNIVRDFGGGGIYGYAADYVHIEGNVVFNTSHSSNWGNSGISLYQCFHSEPTTNETGYRNVIRRNISYGNENKIPFRHGTGGITDGNGIIIDDNRHTQHDSPEGEYQGWTLIENNLVYNNGGRGIHAYLSDRIDVINNTTYLNQFSRDIRGGELTSSQSGTMNFFNNIVIARPEKRANSADGARSDIIIFRNLFFNSDDVIEGMQGIVGLDPALKSPSLGSTDPADFAPRPGSPAIDSAIADVAPTDDLFGNPRKGKPDLGAIEFGSSHPSRVTGQGGSK